MGNIKIKFDDKKLKKEIQRKLENITYNNFVEETRKEGNMFVLQKLEEEVLSIILEKYDGNENMSFREIILNSLNIWNLV